MRSFADIRAIAAARKGGEDALDAALPSPEPAKEIAARPDDRWLSGMTRHVFSAGFSWKVIETKWPGFEEAFHGFDPGSNAMMSDDDLDAHLKNRGIVRNAQKILAVRDNAIFVQELAKEHGGAGRFFAGWPSEDFSGLLELLKKRGSRLGGASAQYFLRYQGVDGYALSRDVVAALIREGVIDKPPTSKKAMAAVQDAFNRWSAESGRPLMQVSRTLAMSIDV